MSGPAINLPGNAIPGWEVSSSPVASDGVVIPMAAVAQAFAYNGSNQITTITVSYKGNVYVQTYTYTGGNLTGISLFVKQ